MSTPIEDYAVIGNCETLALVSRSGSIDWMCMPRFDSAACFAALLGTPDHGRWLIAPAARKVRITRRYRGATLILETVFETATGAVRVTDCMARRDGCSDLIRVVRGLRGSVAMRCELVVRFDDGSAVPWVTQQREDADGDPVGGSLRFAAGPDSLTLRAGVPLHGEGLSSVATFTVDAGVDVTFALTHAPSYGPVPPAPDATAVLASVEAAWLSWSSAFKPCGEWGPAVLRSLLTLKALSHWQTGGIVAAGTTSLPEHIGGQRNWDYRYCWLRDATLTLIALLGAGFTAEAAAWRDWLLRAVAGSPQDLQIMYGVAGERRLTELELPLPGYAGSTPVRVGNAAAGQVQLDVYGEVIGTMYLARKAGLAPSAAGWALECALLRHLETIWQQPDDGIWEVRGGRRHFTHSKVMAWLAFDRALRSAQEFGLDAPVARWCAVRDAIHAQVCERGFDAAQRSFTQSYGAPALDASLLVIPLVGFLPPEDSRVRGTLAAVERGLLRDGVVLRYRTEDGIDGLPPGTTIDGLPPGTTIDGLPPRTTIDGLPPRTTIDGLPPGEGAFLACSFWLVDNYIQQGRLADARRLFKRLLSFRNDVGLLAEQYDPVAKRQLGNFPQAFSHLALVNTARALDAASTAPKRRAAQRRPQRPRPKKAPR